MGDYSYLLIGKLEAMSWKYELPIENDPLLNFIFLSSDKVVEIDTDLEEEEGVIEYNCKYRTTVFEVKKRFDKSHFTIKEIDRVISEVTGIPIENIEIFLMDFDIYYDTFLSNLEDSEHENQNELEDLHDKKIEFDYKIKSSELGNYIELRVIREMLDHSDNTDLVVLDIGEIVGTAKKPEDFDDIMLVKDDLKSATKIDKKYLEMAKIHYTEYHFDLVYIELFISVESALNDCLRMKSKQLSKEKGSYVNLDEVFKKVKLMDKIRFVISFIGKQKLDEELMVSIKEAYHVRNSKIHNNQKNFKRSDAIKAIEDVEKLVAIINGLN
ncbi:MAG TPA: hypothetical protein C5S51_10575 [Methanosarcinaceae archaeon]|nr:hypothetical protein [Methanosarcinaceae archaeon]